MIENKAVYKSIEEEMDPIAFQDLPDDKEFAKEIVKNIPIAEAMIAIDEYTRYVCNRTFEV